MLAGAVCLLNQPGALRHFFGLGSLTSFLQEAGKTLEALGQAPEVPAVFQTFNCLPVGCLRLFVFALGS